MTIREANAALNGFTSVRSLEFSIDADSGECSLRLRLECNVDAERAIEVLLTGVADLNIHNFGSGLAQLLQLRAEDISGEQRDRVNFRICDLERDDFGCVCRTIAIRPGNATISPM